MHLKMEDKVIILTGKDNGQRGEIIAIDRRKGRVKVSRRNMIIKHQKPNQLTGAEGARVEKENWIHASNVALYSEKADGPVRTCKRFVGKDGALFADKGEAVASFGDAAPERIQKVRFSKKTEEVFDAIKA